MYEKKIAKKDKEDAKEQESEETVASDSTSTQS
jgi:hypothetical protein